MKTRHPIIIATLAAMLAGQSAHAQTLFYQSTTAANGWTGSFWGTSAAGPFNTAWVSGRPVEFVDNLGVALALTGATTDFSSIVANESVNVTAGGTLGTGGTVASITVAAGKNMNFGTQPISTAAGTGFIKNGDGILTIATGSTYAGGFTINAGTMAVGGVNAMGDGGILTINGGTIRSDSTTARNLTDKYDLGITIGGDFALGDATNTGALTFSNNVALGAANRIITVNSAVTFGGIVSATGAFGLTKQGAGTLTLSNAGNNYTGATSITAGTLSLTGSLTGGGAVSTSGSGILNQSLATSVISGASSVTLNSAAQNTLVGANTYTGGFTLGAGSTVVVGTSSTGTIGSPTTSVFGAGATAASLGSGSIRSTTVADTEVSNTLTLDGDLTVLNVASEKTLTFSGPATLTGNRTITANVGSSVAGKSVTFSGAIGGGAFSLTKAGTGLMVLSNAGNTYTGATTITAGILNAATFAPGGSNSSIGAGAVAATNLVLNGGTLQYNTAAPATTNRLFSVGTSGGTINSSHATAANSLSFTGTGDIGLNGQTGTRTLTLTGTNTGSNTIALNIVDDGANATSLAKTVSGTWVLSGINSYTGTTTVSNGGGTLQIDAATALPSGSQINLAKQSTVTGTLKLNTSGTNVYNNTFANFASSNGLANGGTPNIQNAQGNNTMSGNMTITNPGGNGVNIQSDAGLLTISGNLNNSSGSGRTFNFGGAGNGVFSGVMSGASGINKLGAGTWSVTGTTSSFTAGVSVLDGVLNVASVADTGSSIGAGGGINLTGQGTSGTFQYTGSAAVTTNRALTVAGTGGTLDASGTGSGTLKFTGTFTATSPNANSLSYTNGSNVARNTNSTAPGTVGGGVMTVTATGLLAGTTITSISGNSYTLSNPFTGATGAVSTTFTDNVARTLTLTGSNTGANEISSNMGNSAGGGVLSVTKTGAGTWVLSGATNSYTGATTVSDGTLAITGTGSINTTSGITVAAGGTLRYNSSTALTMAPTLNGSGVSNRAVLGGTGPINVGVTLDNLGDVLSPGNSPGIQSYTVGQSWSSFSYDWELNNFTGNTAGTDFDQIGITGGLTLSGGSGSYILNVLGLTAGDVAGLTPNFSEIDRSWTILTTTTGITTFNAANWTINTAGFTNLDAGTWALAQSGNNLILSYTAVPEPRAALLGGLGLLMLLRRRRD